MVNQKISDLLAVTTAPDTYLFELANPGISNVKITVADLLAQIAAASTGDVTGPGTSTDNAVARFDSTTGKIIQNSGVTIDDSGNLTANNISGTNTGDQDLSGLLVKTNNLSDLTNTTTARINLGVAIGSDVQAHSSILDATTASFLTADETKLDGIESGAQVNTVDSVNTQTGVVSLDADDIDDTSTTNKFVTAADLTTLSNTSGTNTGDQNDHGLLNGLADDDHTQYHTDARALTWLGTRSTTDLSEGTNLYYTEGRVSANTDVAANTAARHNAVTLTGKDYLILSGQQITLGSIDTDDLENGTASPGASKYYGTNGSSTKGFFDLPAATPGGSTTEIQFNNAGAFGGVTGFTWSSNELLLTAQATTATPLNIKAAASQTANLQEWQNSSGTVLAYVDKDGTFSSSSTTQSERFGATSSSAGTFSAAFGYGASSGGSEGCAFGRSASASAGQAIAIGATATASGIAAIAIGRNVTCSQTNAMAFGAGASATGSSSIAIGPSSSASTTGSLALGSGATSSSGETLAIGNNAASTGSGGVSLGVSSVASSTYTMALGTRAVSSHAFSIAIGRGATTTATNQVVFGAAGNAINNMYLGEGVVDVSPTTNTAINATGGSGTNISGTNLILAGGRPTGSGTGGSVLIQTANTGASGTTLRSLATVVEFKQNKDSVFSGGITPASMADSSASNSTIYYSTTAGKLVFKDSGGTVNNLY